MESNIPYGITCQDVSHVRTCQAMSYDTVELYKRGIKVSYGRHKGLSYNMKWRSHMSKTMSPNNAKCEVTLLYSRCCTIMSKSCKNFRSYHMVWKVLPTRCEQYIWNPYLQLWSPYGMTYPRPYKEDWRSYEKNSRFPWQFYIVVQEELEIHHVHYFSHSPTPL